MTFQPGTSGNPNGRPKLANPVRRFARENALEAIERILGIMRTTKDERLAKDAAVYIVEQAFGKPKETVEVDLLPNEGAEEMLNKPPIITRDGWLKVYDMPVKPQLAA